MPLDPRERFADQHAAVRNALHSHENNMWVTMPGIITKVSDLGGKIVVAVTPALQGTVTTPDDVTTNQTMPEIPDVPVVFPHGGGYTLTFPLKENDECILHFSSRCIDTWWQNGGIQPVTDTRQHDLSDAFCVPGPMSQQKKISNLSTNTVQLRSDDGNEVIEIDQINGAINLKSGTKVRIDSPLTEFTGTISVLNQQGVSVGVNAVGDVKADTIKLKTHLHGGVTAGTADTGVPHP